LARARVLIADDHALMRRAISLALEGTDFEVVAEAKTGAQVLPLVGRCAPDLVLLDILMPEMDGLVCLGKLRARYPDVKIVMLSARDDREMIARALERGASGYIIKRVDPEGLAPALRQVLDGTVVHVAEPANGEGSVVDAGLSAKERAVLAGLAEGRSNKEIASSLWVTEQTVKFHLTNVYRKLGVANRTEAARWAFEHGLVGEHAR
jgi:DNA-binding NarL/FixJ family response regulator